MTWIWWTRRSRENAARVDQRNKFAMTKAWGLNPVVGRRLFWPTTVDFWNATFAMLPMLPMLSWAFNRLSWYIGMAGYMGSRIENLNLRIVCARTAHSTLNGHYSLSTSMANSFSGQGPVVSWKIQSLMFFGEIHFGSHRGCPMSPSMRFSSETV